MAKTTSKAQVEPTAEQRRDQLADDLVKRYSAWSAAAGVIPVPLLDAVAVGGVQLKMLRELTDIYDVPFSENVGKSLIASTIASLAPAGVAPAAASALKIIPGLGSAVGALTMPAMSAGATYALGQVFILHFASGGTLLDFHPTAYIPFLKQTAKP
jgi:uncharacterized protein (DUF697 family)